MVTINDIDYAIKELSLSVAGVFLSGTTGQLNSQNGLFFTTIQEN